MTYRRYGCQLRALLRTDNRLHHLGMILRELIQVWLWRQYSTPVHCVLLERGTQSKGLVQVLNWSLVYTNRFWPWVVKGNLLTLALLRNHILKYNPKLFDLLDLLIVLFLCTNILWIEWREHSWLAIIFLTTAENCRFHEQILIVAAWT